MFDKRLLFLLVAEYEYLKVYELLGLPEHPNDR
jgi:hypothetical protein